MNKKSAITPVSKETGRSQALPFRRNDYQCAVLAGAMALPVYCATMSPVVTGEDCGELVTAAYTMGIAHPPGYPLWCILGKLFSFIPYGTVAWRVSFASAFFGAVTVSLCVLIANDLTRNRFAAVIAALAFAFSSEFWSQNIIAEVYALNSFFIALCILLLLRWRETLSVGTFWLFAFLFGLSLTNHNTMEVVAPVFAVFVLLVDRRPWLQWRMYAIAAVLAIIPLSIYAYLPIRSAANPPADWGNPETWQNFWDVVTRKQYTFMFTQNPRSVGRFAQQCWVFITLYGQEFTPWFAWAPPAGAVLLWVKDRLSAFLLLGSAAAVLFSVILVNNFSITREDIWVNHVFWIPVYMVAGIAMSAVIDAVMRVRKNKAAVRAVSYVLGVAMVVSPLAWNYHGNNKHHYYFAYDYVTNIFKTMEPNAIYFPAADHATFPAIYLQAVECMRPDVTIANKYGYPEESVYADMPAEQRKQFHKIPTEAEERIIEDWVIEHNKDKPIYFTKKRSFERLHGVKLVSNGLLYRVTREGENAPEKDFFAGYTWHTLDENQAIGELTAEMVVSDVDFAMARTSFEKGDTADALRHVEAALRVGGESKESLNNAGSLCAENRQLDAAERYYLAALKIDPNYDLTVRNVGKVYLQQGNYKAALPYFEKLLHKNPLEPEANWLAYDCLKGQLRFDDALAQLKRMTTFPYEDPRVYRELGMHYLNNEQKPQLALQMFTKSLSLDAHQQDLTDLVTKLRQQPATAAMAGSPTPESLMPKLPMPAIPSPQAPSPTAPFINQLAPGGAAP